MFYTCQHTGHVAKRYHLVQNTEEKNYSKLHSNSEYPWLVNKHCWTLSFWHQKQSPRTNADILSFQAAYNYLPLMSHYTQTDKSGNRQRQTHKKRNFMHWNCEYNEPSSLVGSSIVSHTKGRQPQTPPSCHQFRVQCWTLRFSKIFQHTNSRTAETWERLQY